MPDFQRNFSWTGTHGEIFWQDLLAFSDVHPKLPIDDEYFLGAIVLVRRSGEHIVLDGQQRLATATILLSVIRDLLRENGNADASTRTQAKFISELDDFTGGSNYNLTLNVYDRDFFRATVQDIGATAPASKLESHGLITGAQNFFKEMLGRKLNSLSNNGDFVKWLLRIRKVLTDHLSVVVVSSDDEDNATTIFETLNDRGIGLSAPDLLRSFLLQQGKSAEREEIVGCWREILSIEEDTRVEDFLRHYWLSLRGDVKARSLYRQIKQTFVDEKWDALTFSRELRAAAALYRNVVVGRDEDAECSERLGDIRELGARVLIPCVLSCYAVGNLEQRRAFLGTLVAGYVRYAVIGGREASKFESVIYGAASSLRANSKFNVATSALAGIVPKTPQFEQDLQEVRITRARVARCILRRLEGALWKTGEVGAGSDAAKLNLEHIYPENPSGTRLSNHSEWVPRLGNLTLLGRAMNRELKNSDFAAKKAIYAASEIKMTKTLATLPTWDEVSIAARQKELATLALKLWAFPGI